MDERETVGWLTAREDKDGARNGGICKRDHGSVVQGCGVGGEVGWRENDSESRSVKPSEEEKRRRTARAGSGKGTKISNNSRPRISFHPEPKETHVAETESQSRAETRRLIFAPTIFAKIV